MSDEPPFKVVFCGDSAVGKTSIVHKRCFNCFTPQMMPTMGADFVSHVVRVPDGEVALSIWDTAGQEQYQAIGPLFYRSAALAFVVYAATDDRPLEKVQIWIDRMHSAEARAKIVAFGNKIDLVGRPTAEVADWCAGHQIPHFFCSALTGTGIRDGFQGAAAILLAARPPRRAAVLLQPAPPEPGCC
jgi:small GTP-binding protein